MLHPERGLIDELVDILCLQRGVKMLLIFDEGLDAPKGIIGAFLG
jgi:hypothetical protein